MYAYVRIYLHVYIYIYVYPAAETYALISTCIPLHHLCISNETCPDIGSHEWQHTHGQAAGKTLLHWHERPKKQFSARGFAQEPGELY